MSTRNWLLLGAIGAGLFAVMALAAWDVIDGMARLRHRLPPPAAEDSSVIGAIRGFLLYSELDDEVLVVRLPDLERTSIPMGGRVYDVSGPARDGRFVAAVNASKATTFELRNLVDPSVRRRLAVADEGLVLDRNLVRCSISPDGKRLSFLVVADADETEPSSARSKASARKAHRIRILSIDDGTSIDGPPGSGRIAWTSDGERVVFAAFPGDVDRWIADRAGNPRPAPREAREPPAVYTFHLATAAVLRLGDGACAITSAEGDGVLFEEADGIVSVLDGSGAVKARGELPTRTGGCHAIVGGDVVVHDGVPATGHDPGLHISPGGISVRWVLRATSLSTQRTCTLVDVRGPASTGVSFGAIDG